MIKAVEYRFFNCKKGNQKDTVTFSKDADIEGLQDEEIIVIDSKSSATEESAKYWAEYYFNVHEKFNKKEELAVEL